jgi:hypothetical protein
VKAIHQGHGHAIRLFLAVARVAWAAGAAAALILEARRVRDYAWSPDGANLVLCVGDPGKTAQDDFVMTGVFRLNVATSEKAQIFGANGRWAAWARFDGAIYILEAPPGIVPDEHRVWRYILRSGSLELTPHRGIHFSPSGAYYYRGNTYCGDVGLFETSTDRGLHDSSALARESPGWRPIGWTAEDDLLLTFSQSTRRYGGAPTVVLYDPRRDVVTYLGWTAVIGSRDGELVTSEDGLVRVESVGNLLKRMESIHAHGPEDAADRSR